MRFFPIKEKRQQEQGDKYHNYTFTGWTPEIKPVVSDIEYMTTYERVDIIFTIRCAFFSCSSLTTIDFAGSINQWINVTKGTNWTNETKETYVTCPNGTYNI